MSTRKKAMGSIYVNLRRPWTGNSDCFLFMFFSCSSSFFCFVFHCFMAICPPFTSRIAPENCQKGVFSRTLSRAFKFDVMIVFVVLLLHLISYRDLYDIKLHQNLMFHRYLMKQDSLFTLAAFVLRF